MKKTKQLNWFTVFYGQVAIIFPFIVAAPRYFSGKIRSGKSSRSLLRSGRCRARCPGSSTHIRSSPTGRRPWTALTVSPRRSSAHASRRSSSTGEREEASSTNLVVQDLALGLPTGQALLAPTTLELKKDESVLITGPVGRREEHAVPRARRHLALLERKDRAPQGGEAALPAAEALPAARLAQARSLLSRAGRPDQRR